LLLPSLPCWWRRRQLSLSIRPLYPIAITITTFPSVDCLLPLCAP
jgi:hypothetical protein